MSGLEVYGAIAATVSLIKVISQLKDYPSRRTARTQELLEQTRRNVQLSEDNLRASFRAISVNYDTYRRDVEPSLGPSGREAITIIIKEIINIRERCQRTLARMEAVVKKDPLDQPELRRLQHELASAVQGIQGQHHAFTAQITMDTLRRVSETTTSPVSDSDSGRLNRRNTDISTTTTLSPASTSRSSAGSAESSHSLTFIKHESLKSAVEGGDLEMVSSFINVSGKHAESLKATSLLLACRYRKIPVIRLLFSLDASMRLRDDNGSGVLHCAIGTVPPMKSSLPNILESMKLLVERGASMSITDRPKERTPLHYCVITGNYEATRFAIHCKPTLINQVDADGKTPLYHACEDTSPNCSLIELLLEKDATFAKKRRPSITSRKKKHAITAMLDKVEMKRALSERRS